MTYQLTLIEPLKRHFALADQIRRAAMAIPANLAEGYALGTRPQFVRHIRIAVGSASELWCHLTFASEMGLVSGDRAKPAVELNMRVISLLVGLLRHFGAAAPKKPR